MNIHLETKHDQPSDAAKNLPFTPLLPTDYEGLLRWRIYVRERCLEDPDFRTVIVQACAEDLSFFSLTFGWIHETREGQERLGEFIPLLDPDQIDILAWLQQYAGRIDMTIEKTRGVGLSYLACFLCSWTLLFDRHSPEIGMLSKDEYSLDEPRRPKSLLGKLDLFLEKLPRWMTHDSSGKPIIKRLATKHSFENTRTNAALVGLVPTDEKTRSGRFRYLVVDEGAFLPIEDQKWLAAAYGTTPSTIWISTHNGTATLFFKMTRNEDADLVRISTWWWENRRCRRGLYRVNHGEIEILDPDYKFPEGYFDRGQVCWDFQGVLRSPWVDKQFRRPNIDAARVFEELYGLTGAESRGLIRKEVFKIIDRTSRKPHAIGDLVNGEWVDDMDGPLRVWFDPGQPAPPCTIGVDPALSETAGAYAAACAISHVTGEQILSYRNRTINPTAFPDKVEEIARWLASGGALPRIAFESQGVGIVFATGMERLRYPLLGHEEGKSKPGYGNNDKGAAWLLELGRAIYNGEVTVRDEVLGLDLAGFEYDGDWELVFASIDGHGDLAQAAGLAWHEAKGRRQARLRAQRRNRLNADEVAKLGEIARMNRCWSDQFRRDYSWR